MQNSASKGYSEARFRWGLHPWLRSSLVLLATLTAVAVVFWLLSLGLAKVPEPIGSRSALFVEGAKNTLLLTLLAGVSGLFIGLTLSFGCLSQWFLVRWPSKLLVWVLRGTPLLVQILFAFFALPALLPWLQLDDFSAALIALAFNVGAYNSEVIRAGILAIPRGQEEAALSLGLGKIRVMFLVILPQALRIVVPPLVNNVVALLKDSSLASSIGLLELALAGNRISSETFLPVPVLTTVAGIYLLLTTGLTAVTHVLERILTLPAVGVVKRASFARKVA